MESAKRLKAAQAKPQGAQALLGAAGASDYAGELDAAEVVIHHTIGSWTGEGAQYVATLDVGKGGKSQTSRARISIDESGARLSANSISWPKRQGDSLLATPRAVR